VSYRILFTHSYTRRAEKFVRRHPELPGQYGKTLRLLEADPFHPALRLHRLEGRLSALHAVSISIRYRISILLEIREKTVIPVDVGSHDEVYR
jgi:toxin HigB-1